MSELINTEKKCYICLRITPEKVLKYSHQLFGGGSPAREIGLKASKIIYEGSKRKPTFFCGKKEGTLLAGLFLLLRIEFEAKRLEEWMKREGLKPSDHSEYISVLRQSHSCLQEIFDVTPQTIRKSYVDWIINFPKFFSGFELKKEFYTIKKPTSWGLKKPMLKQKDRRLRSWLYYKGHRT